MIEYLEIAEVLVLQKRIIETSGGGFGMRDVAGLESALAQPQTIFFGQELYPKIADKGAILGFSIIINHPFVDGNKRIGHAAIEAFLMLNGYEINALMEEQEEVILQVAAGEMNKEDFAAWLENPIEPTEN